MTNKEFAEKYGQAAVDATAGSGIFPQTLLSQAILESNSGKSQLSSKHNNFFGIKADKSWTGAKVIMRTREVQNGKSIYIDSAFRKYATPVDSFKDYVAFLKKNPRYTKAGVFKATNFNEQIDAIAKSGYATATNYATSVKKVAANLVETLKKFVPSKDTTLSFIPVIAILGFIFYIKYHK